VEATAGDQRLRAEEVPEDLICPDRTPRPVSATKNYIIQ